MINDIIINSTKNFKTILIVKLIDIKNHDKFLIFNVRRYENGLFRN